MNIKKNKKIRLKENQTLLRKRENNIKNHSLLKIKNFFEL